MLSKVELQRLASHEKIALGVLEKDYILTQVLNHLELVPGLSDLLVFKGGTVLRKVYFQDWRYSEDLDFTVKHDMSQHDLETHLKSWYAIVLESSQISLSTSMLHKPNGYARLRIQFVGPLVYPGKIFMDLSFDEPLCIEPVRRPLITHPFSDKPRIVLAYPLEELAAEKMRSMLERGKSRDYYDVWRLLKEHSSGIDSALLIDVFGKKLKHKNLMLKSIDDFFPADIKTIERYWSIELEHQLSDLPPLTIVLQELHSKLDGLLKF